MVKKPFLFLLEPLKKAEFKGKLSVVDARKEPNELSRTILPECCLPGKGSSGEREYWGSQSGKETLYLSCLLADIQCQQGYVVLPATYRPENGPAGDCPAGIWLSHPGDRASLWFG